MLDSVGTIGKLVCTIVDMGGVSGASEGPDASIVVIGVDTMAGD